MTNGLCPFMQPPHVFYLQWIEVAGCTPWQRQNFSLSGHSNTKIARPFFSGSLYSFYTWKKVMVNKVCVCVNTQRMCSIKHEIEKLEEIFLLRFPLHFLLLSCQESQSPLLKVHVVTLCYMLEVILLKCKMNLNLVLMLHCCSKVFQNFEHPLIACFCIS